MLYFRARVVGVVRRGLEAGLHHEEILEKLNKVLDDSERIYKCEGCGLEAGMYGDVPFPKEIEDDTEWGHIAKGCMCMSCLCESSREGQWRPFFVREPHEDDD